MATGATLFARSRRDRSDDNGGICALDQTPSILMASPVFDEILDAIGSRPPEAGGVLLGPKNHRAITHFLFDDTGVGTPASFTWDSRGLTKLLKHYVACGIDVKGFVHSHPRGITTLSGGDLAYAERCFAADKGDSLTALAMPLVVDGLLYPYLVLREEPLEPTIAQLVLF